MADPFEDALLVRQVQTGELHAFTLLVRKYQDRVYNTCWRVCGHSEDARDLTQEAFLKAFESIASFQGKSAFFTWIFRVAVNLSISHQRKRRVRLTMSLDQPFGTDGTARSGDMATTMPDSRLPEPAAAFDASETHQQVADALTRLEADQRAVLILRDVEGLDYQAIADVLEMPVGTVKSRIYRGRTALRTLLKSQGVEEAG
jgi:RNA polymerase sigma-70 factor (ECF subfamily)